MEATNKWEYSAHPWLGQGENVKGRRKEEDVGRK